MNQQDIGYLLKQINDKIKVSADADLKESGLTISQTMVMDFLYERGGQATQKEIENYLNVSHPTVVGIVSRLKKSGFVTCHVDEADRRNKIVCITEKASECAQIMYQGRKATESRLVRSMSDQDISELRRLLQIIYRNLE